MCLGGASFGVSLPHNSAEALSGIFFSFFVKQDTVLSHAAFSSVIQSTSLYGENQHSNHTFLVFQLLLIPG